jgi:hypothetical protein
VDNISRDYATALDQLVRFIMQTFTLSKTPDGVIKIAMPQSDGVPIAKCTIGERWWCPDVDSRIPFRKLTDI